MSRGGGNPNWEYQLVHRDGHTQDIGLRQRRMVTSGHRGPDKRQAQRTQRRTARALDIPLEKLFDILTNGGPKK